MLGTILIGFVVLLVAIGVLGYLFFDSAKEHAKLANKGD